MTKNEALKLALDYIVESNKSSRFWLVPASNLNKTVTAIKEALAQPEQEPVAFYVYKPTLPRGHLGNVSDGDLPWVYDQDPSSGYSARMLVYTTPPQRKPLTDEEIAHATAPVFMSGNPTLTGIARAIEAAHGIKGDT